jgi:hypothetical protein
MGNLLKGNCLFLLTTKPETNHLPLIFILTTKITNVHEKIEPEILEHIEKGEPMEVSTGLFSDCVLEEGMWNGESYDMVAQNIRADHLAILPDKDGAGLLVNQATQTETRSGSGGKSSSQVSHKSLMSQKEIEVLNSSEAVSDIESKLSGLYGKKAILKKMIESAASDEEREKLQLQYNALDAEVKKFEGVSEPFVKNIQNAILSKIAEVMMYSSQKMVEKTKSNICAKTKTVNNASTLLPVGDSAGAPPIPATDNTKPKTWSFNTLRQELERLVNEALPHDKNQTSRSYVIKEMEKVRGVAPVRHDDVLKSTREQLLEMALSIEALRKHHAEELKKKAAG